MSGKDLKKKKNQKKDLHLYLDSRAVFSFYMCKSTTWFLCKQSTNSERVIPWSTEYRFIFLTFKSPILRGLLGKKIRNRSYIEEIEWNDFSPFRTKVFHNT